MTCPGGVKPAVLGHANHRGAQLTGCRAAQHQWPALGGCGSAGPWPETTVDGERRSGSDGRRETGDGSGPMAEGGIGVVEEVHGDRAVLVGMEVG
jgi:hypothetical protein